MPKTKQVRVFEDEYNLIKSYADKNDISFAEAVRELIRDDSLIVNGDVIQQGDFETDSMDKLVNGAMMAGGAYFLKKLLSNDD
jgi:hypothetical protein